MHRTTDTSLAPGGQQSSATSKLLAVECEIPVMMVLSGAGCLLVQTLPDSLDRLRGPASGRVRLRSRRVRVEPAAGGAVALQRGQRRQGRRLERRPGVAGARDVVRTAGAIISPRTTVD